MREQRLESAPELQKGMPISVLQNVSAAWQLNSSKVSIQPSLNAFTHRGTYGISIRLVIGLNDPALSETLTACFIRTQVCMSRMGGTDTGVQAMS